MQAGLPPDSVEHRQLDEAIAALEAGFQQLPDKARVSN